MKVYIVMMEVSWEGSYVKGVYATEALANIRKNELIKDDDFGDFRYEVVSHEVKS